MAENEQQAAEKKKARITDLGTWFALLDRFEDVPFMEDGDHQPPMPEAENLFDDSELDQAEQQSTKKSNCLE